MVVVGNILLTITMLCLISAAGLKWAVGGWMPIIPIMLGVAGVSFVASVFINAKYYLAVIKSDSFNYLLKSIAMTALVFSFLVAINYLGVTNNSVFDFTSNKINSLTEFSQKTVSSLDKEFMFYFFKTDSPEAGKEEAYVRSSIEAYQRLSPKIKLKVVSIYKDPELTAKFNIGDEPSAFFATFEGRRKRIQIISETEITSAILQLSRPEKVLYFTQAHGERKLQDSESYGIAVLKAELERLFYKVKPLNEFPVPGDASFLAVVGPRLQFDEAELKAIADFVKGGGSLILALDPGESQNLPQLVKQFGVEFQNTFVSSLASEQSPFAVFVSSTNYEHDLLKTLQGDQRPLFFLSSPLKLAQSGEEGQKVTPLLRFAVNSVSRTEIDKKSAVSGEGGQIAATITEVTSKEGTFSRVLVVGDSDFLTNQFIGQHANFNFVFNAINYLSREKDILNVKPRRAKTTYLMMTQTQLNFYVLFFILPFPFIYFIIALFLKLRRAF